MIIIREFATEHERKMIDGADIDKLSSGISISEKNILFVPEKKGYVQIIAKVNPEIKELLDKASEISGKTKTTIIVQGILVECIRLLTEAEKEG